MNLTRTDRFWILAALLAGMFLAAGCRSEQPSMWDSMDVAEALAGDTAGYARADRPHQFVFPEDHGPHPAFRTEWWYYTGNLYDETGGRFGYQFTIFRTSLRPPSDEIIEDGSWATDQLYMAHIAVSDLEGEIFIVDERFSRESAGLAGAHADPYRVWLTDWSASATGSEFEHQRIRASTDDIVLDLELEALKPIVLHGEDGLDRKSPVPGDASYYYTLTRWATDGTITIGEDHFQVSGTSWLDREWSTSVLGEEIRGWDWFALQFDDGHDLMYYQLRDADGAPTGFSGGVIVDPDGERYPFGHDTSTLTATATWRSPLGGTYPSGWELSAPELGIELVIEPVRRDQELDVTVRYWEGPVDVEGTLAGTGVRGTGYVELTGYAESARSRLSRN